MRESFSCTHVLTGFIVVIYARIQWQIPKSLDFLRFSFSNARSPSTQLSHENSTSVLYEIVLNTEYSNPKHLWLENWIALTYSMKCTLSLTLSLFQFFLFVCVCSESFHFCCCCYCYGILCALLNV